MRECFPIGPCSSNKKEYNNIYLHPWIEENKIKFNDYPDRYNVIDDFNYCSDLYEKILPEVSKILKIKPTVEKYWNNAC